VTLLSSPDTEFWSCHVHMIIVFFMPNSIALFFRDVLPPHSFIHPDRCCYHHISWTLRTVLTVRLYASAVYVVIMCPSSCPSITHGYCTQMAKL